MSDHSGDITDSRLQSFDLRSHDVVGNKRDQLLRRLPEARTQGGEIEYGQLRRGWPSLRAKIHEQLVRVGTAVGRHRECATIRTSQRARRELDVNPIKMTPSLILVAVAAIIFAIAAYEADPRELKNVSFDLCLGLCVYMISILAGAFTGKS